MAGETPSSSEVVKAPEAAVNQEAVVAEEEINGLNLGLVDYGMEQVGMVDRMTAQLGSTEALELQLTIANEQLRFLDSAALALTFDHLGNHAVDVSVQKQLTELLGIEWRKTLTLQGTTAVQSTYATIGDLFIGSDKAGGERTVTMGYIYTGDTLEVTVMASADATQPNIPTLGEITPTVGLRQGPLYASMSVPVEGAESIQNYAVALGVELPAGITAQVQRTPDEMIASLGATYRF